MLILPLSEDKMPQLIVLARELEPLFEGAMADNPEFLDYFRRKISQKEALAAIDRVSGALMGVIAFSRVHNRISWLGVFPQWQNQGVGTCLLHSALNQLDPTQGIWVTTFRDDNTQGLPARSLYQKFGFSDCDCDVLFDGHPRCLMRKQPE